MIRTYQRQLGRPRLLVCKRQLARRKPGTPTPIYEPTIVHSTYDAQDALGAVARTIKSYRDLKFTIWRDPNHPNRFEVFRLNAIGEWVDYEIYITEVTL